MMIKPIEELTFTDDYMFGRVMQNPEICKGLLERLLEIKIEKVEYPTLQKSISQYYETKGIRLDVYVKDSDKVFDIEIQNNPQIDLPKRTRYYQSMVDMDNLLKGQDYSDLKEVLSFSFANLIHLIKTNLVIRSKIFVWKTTN